MQQARENVSGTGACPSIPLRNEECHKNQSQESAMIENFPGLIELLELIKDDSVATLLSQLPDVAKLLPYAGAVLAGAKTFLPDKNHEAIIQWFEKLSEQLANVKQELVNTIKMESVRLRYGSDIVTIQTAIDFSVNIAKARNDDAKRNGYIDKFKDVCSGEKLALAMNNLIAGLDGKCGFQIQIMDRYYESTGGHLPKVRSLAKELLKLVYVGLMVMFRYETLMHDERFAEVYISNYNDRLKDVQKKIEGVFDRCKNELRDNMLKDIDEILDSHVSNTDAVTALSSFVSEKYDWLDNYCIVCDETTAHMDCYFKGSYVQSFGRNSKFGVVFYQEATEAAVDPGRQQEVKAAIESLHRLCDFASQECEELLGILLAKGIETWGCAVITPRYPLLSIPIVDMYSNIVYRFKLATLQEEGSSSAAVHQMQKIGRFTRTTPYRSQVSLFPGFSIYYLVLLK